MKCLKSNTLDILGCPLVNQLNFASIRRKLKNWKNHRLYDYYKYYFFREFTWLYLDKKMQQYLLYI